MLEFVDAAAIANQVSLLRDTYRGTVLLVEGPDDGCVFEKFKARDDACRVVPAHGKTNAIGALQLLRQRGHGTCVLVIVDADFWHLTGEEPDDAEILLTEFHDLEMDMAATSALDDVLRELCGSDSVKRFERIHGVSLRTRLLTEAARIGLLRFINYQDVLRLHFRDVQVERYVDQSRLSVDLEGYLSQVLEDSAVAVDVGYLRSRTGRAAVSDQDLPQLARGHDYTVLLAVGLRSALARHSPAVANREHVEALLRLAYSRDYFDRSALARAIGEWELRTGCVVLD